MKILLLISIIFIGISCTKIPGNQPGAVIKVCTHESEVEIYKPIDFCGAVQGVNEIEIMIDGWSIGRIRVKENQYSLMYAIKHPRKNRKVDVIGYLNGEEKTREVYYLDVLDQKYFNKYLLKAVQYLDSNYGRLGYGKGVLTHDIQFYKYGMIRRTKNALSMCVSAQLEIILEAYRIYSEETGDYSVYEYLDIKHYKSLGTKYLKRCIWVDSKLGCHGTASALEQFGMGKLESFDKLKPGSFINLNRKSGSGHAVLYLNFIDRDGNEIKVYDKNVVVGFRYYSSQGRSQPGKGGLGYRFAFFSPLCPTLSGGKKRDCGIIKSSNQKMLNTGLMYHPAYWEAPRVASMGIMEDKEDNYKFDIKRFDGVTTDMD